MTQLRLSFGTGNMGLARPKPEPPKRDASQSPPPLRDSRSASPLRTPKPHSRPNPMSSTSRPSSDNGRRDTAKPKSNDPARDRQGSHKPRGDPSRRPLVKIAEENEAIVHKGHYIQPQTQVRVNIADMLAASLRDTRAYNEDSVADILTKVKSKPSPGYDTVFEVTAETTTEATERLVFAGHAPTGLNFASAKHPGGGYLTGARAQEEDICRHTALFTTLIAQTRHFAAQKKMDGRYSHRMIWSPSVPQYRGKDYVLLNDALPVSWITAAAPNKGALAKQNPPAMASLPALLSARIQRLLAVCAHKGATTLVLGAWGCGVFRNDPADIAALFKRHLMAGGVFEGRFEHVTFAIYDPSASQETMNAFKDAFPVGPRCTHAVQRASASPPPVPSGNQDSASGSAFLHPFS